MSMSVTCVRRTDTTYRQRDMPLGGADRAAARHQGKQTINAGDTLEPGAVAAAGDSSEMRAAQFRREGGQA